MAEGVLGICEEAWLGARDGNGPRSYCLRELRL